MTSGDVLTPQVLVIGGGPAGLCSGIEACRAGVEVLVIDDKDRPGGQLIKQTHMFFGSKQERAGIRGVDIAGELLEEFRILGGQMMTEAMALGLFEDGSVGVLHRDQRFLRILPEKIIIATGAYENALAFPNCDLPGVYGAGGFQTLMNTDGVLPGKKVLMVGAGNIGLIVSYQLLQAGGDVVAVVEATPNVGGYWVHAAKIKRAGIGILLQHSIKSVGGDGHVEHATIVKLKDLKEIPGSEFTVECDAVCLSVGLSPLTELFFNAGCRMKYISALGGYVPEHDDNMMTSNEDIFVAGDASGIEEASAAMVEGKIAGCVAAGSLDGSDLFDKVEGFKKQLAALRSGPFGSKVLQGKFDLWGRSYKDMQHPPRTFVEPSVHFEKGTRLVFECSENIPCNPCEESCRQGAIHIGHDINAIPVYDPDKCNACGICLTRCPGLCIFMINKDFSDDRAEITIAYELLPVPEQGQIWWALDREGVFLCQAEITKVRSTKAFDRKALVSFAVPKNFSDNARHIAPVKELKKLQSIDLTPEDSDPVVCRCEDIRLSQVEQAIEAGYDSFDEIKRILRVGMGPCQGKTCQRIILGVLSRKLGVPVDQLAPMRVRSPIKPVSIEVMAKVDLSKHVL